MMKDKSKVLHAKELHKSFYDPQEITILAGVSLEVYQGDTVAIMGASGEGKSTLLQILGSLESPSSGELEIVGEKVTAANSHKIRGRNIGFVFQAFHLLEDYTALENVLMPAKIANKDLTPGSPSHMRGLKLLEEVGLKERASFKAKHLSGGEKQRVALARALCNDPEILLADEPTGNLDHATSSQIHELLLNFVRTEQKALIVVTHDQELAKLMDHLYVLRNATLHKEK